MTKQESALELLGELSEQLVSIAEEARGTGDYQTGFEKLRRWKARAARQIGERINNVEGKKLQTKRKSSFRMGDPVGNLIDEARMYSGFLEALDDEIKNHPDDVLNRAEPTSEPEPREPIREDSAQEKNCIFIVHGHDELNLLRAKELVRDRWDLEAVVLSGQPGKGRTLVEKFEEEAQRASFAFVLLTPDDVITQGKNQYGQARPNVIFELGWFYGRLGRERVCILFKNGTKIHSDLDGVSRIEFQDSVTEITTEIESELVAVDILKRSN